LTLGNGRRHDAPLADLVLAMALAVSPLSPPEVVAILRSARVPTADPRLADLLGAFQRQWRALARKRYPRIGDDLDDAVQEAMTKLTDPRRLDSLRDPACIEAWARSLFVHAVLDLLRAEQAHAAVRAPRAARGDEEDEESIIDLLAIGAPGPEETAAHQQRLQLVVDCIAGLEVARLKFLEDLPDNEIAARCNLTRDGVAGQLKRLRKRLRHVLEAGDRIGKASGQLARGERG